MAAKKHKPQPKSKTAKPKAKPVAKSTPAKKASAKPKAKRPAAKSAAKKPTAKPLAKNPATKSAAKKPTARPQAPSKGRKPATKKGAAKKPVAAAAKKPLPPQKASTKPPVSKKQPPAKSPASQTKTTTKATAPKTVAGKAEPSTVKAPPTPKGGSHSPAFIQKQRQKLLDLRDSLVDSMSGISRDTIRNAPEGSEASGSGQHQGDAGSDAYDRDFALSVLAKEQDALYEIEQALRRIQAGTYGICEISHKKIPQARLEAIPFARLTVECQAQWEKDYGNRRFRSSNEVGFSGGNYAEDDDSESVSLDEDDD